MSKFYEALVLPHESNSVYRELLLVDSDETCERVKSFRPSSWAVLALRIDTAQPDDASGDTSEAESDLLVIGRLCIEKPRRYERMIILKGGPPDNIDALVARVRQHLPSLVEDRRLFIAELANQGEACSPEAVKRAVGGAEPLA